MPREREEFFRESNTTGREKIFVLAFEGNVTEEKYFSEFKNSNKFNDELIYLHLLKREKDDTNAVSRAKNLDQPQEEYPTKLGSHIYKLIEKLRKEEAE